MEFWASKRSKYMQNLTFCPFFELQKPVLGELSFYRANDLQIQKFQLGWKVDSQTFPTSYPAPNYYACKCLKQSSQCAQPVRQMCATCQANFARFHCNSSEKHSLTWFDFLRLMMILFDVIVTLFRHFYPFVTLLEDLFM